jgi:hypothetical protein
MRALLRTDTPPDDAEPVFGAVHLASMDENLLESASSALNLRFFVGYAGWAPGQLERELAHGSWHVLPATEEVVFAKDPGSIWQQLLPAREYRVSIDIVGAGMSDLLLPNAAILQDPMFASVEH